MKRAYVILALCIAGGVLVGAAWPPPAVPPYRDDAGNWALPSPERIARNPADSFAQASKLRWQGDGGGGGPDNAAASVAWKFAGLTEAGQVQALVIEGEAKQVRRLSPGDSLPDGGRLIGIERDTITVDNNGCVRVHQMHRRQPIRSSGSCTDASAVSD